MSTLSKISKIIAPSKPRLGSLRLVGRVVSDKMHKTVVVRVDHRVWHNKYHRFVVRRRNFFAHDEGIVIVTLFYKYIVETCTPGDIVAIERCQKTSKHKHFEVSEILKMISPL